MRPLADWLIRVALVLCLGAGAALAQGADGAGGPGTGPGAASDATGGGAGGATQNSLTDAQPSGPRPEIDFDLWDQLASRVEGILDEGSAEIPRLEALRAEVAAFRDRLNSQQNEQSARTATLQSQIDALGPAPAEGETEAPEIAQRRAQLTAQLEEARAPIVAAEEAFTRADGIIREIDATIRARATEALFNRGPTPLNPALWPEAVEAVIGSAVGFVTETDREIARGLLSDNRINVPLASFLLLVGLILLLRGRSWAERGAGWLRNATRRRGTGVWRTLASFGMVVLPVGGIVLISVGAQMTGYAGPRGELLLERLPIWVGVFAYIRWLAQQTFSPDEEEATLPLEGSRRTEARYYFGALALLMILSGVTVTFSRADGYSDGVNAVLSFAIVTFASLLLFRLGTIFRRARLEGDSEDGAEEERHDPMHFRLRLARVFGRLLTLSALAAPIFSATGLQQVAQTLTFPMIATMVLAGTILLLLRFIGDLYKLIVGHSPQETNSLIPVFAGFSLILASIPALALIWGARVADLTELWNTFLAGFEIGESVISPADFLSFLLVFMLGYAVTRGTQTGLRATVLPKTRIDIGGQNAIVAGVGYLGIFLAALVAFTTAGIDLSSLAIVAGALSVGIGFGLQNIVSNFVSGIILLIERPIGEGDWIAVGDNMGFVKDISVRSTRIETFDRFDVIVPNSDLVTGTVTNYTRGNTLGRLIVPVKVAYGSDTRAVHRILLSIARAHPIVMMNPEPYVYFKGFGENGIEFEIRVILSDILEIFEVQTEMNHQIAERFAAEGIRIPIPQRDLWLRNPETLQGGAAESGKPPEGRGFASPDQSPQSMTDKGPLPDNVARSTGGGDPDGE
ncbi:Small-conductance mechanosensitive channel [Roseivivax lentus]|uniref:Small-conductance mechanosensitive channel n=1 Tax=Roseivivax lentus TaxID=633194 RepID=A0A1N7NPA4_9RHOB|nr:DUF3772 domain-containing protein [Roseivivax lentus]SIT00156.1 Small-conductance mechanosensitive channel [Roseivivax lentus]